MVSKGHWKSLEDLSSVFGGTLEIFGGCIGVLWRAGSRYFVKHKCLKKAALFFYKALVFCTDFATNFILWKVYVRLSEVAYRVLESRTINTFGESHSWFVASARGYSKLYVLILNSVNSSAEA